MKIAHKPLLRAQAKVFSTLFYLLYSLIHTQVKFRCKICGYLYSRKDTLKDHIRGKHNARFSTQDLNQLVDVVTPANNNGQQQQGGGNNNNNKNGNNYISSSSNNIVVGKNSNNRNNNSNSDTNVAAAAAASAPPKEEEKIIL